jgi:hypothetical protein
MSTINRTVQTALRGAALQTAVRNMLVELQGMRPAYRSLTIQWPSATRAVLSYSTLINGTVDLRDGNPSTVAVNITFGTLVESMRPQAELDAMALAQRYLAPAGGQPGPADTTSTRQAPAESGRSGLDLSTFTEIVQSAGEALPALVGRVRETIEETAAAARGQDIVKPGTRAPHAPDVAEAIPLWQRSWVRWTLGAVVVGGAGYMVYKAVKR